MSEKNTLRNKKQLSDLNLIDDFLFNMLLSSKEYGESFARMLLEIILQRKIGSVHIHPQKTFYGSDPKHKGVRLDVLIEEHVDDANTPFNTIDLEVDQNKNTFDKETWPLRARYYHSIIDTKIMKSGDNYDKLCPVYVIIIMNYDPWKAGRLVYTAKRLVVEDTSIPYDDKATTLFLYTKGKPDKSRHQEELASLLRYIENTDSKYAINDILKKMHGMVTQIKSDKEVGEVFMKSWEIEEMLRREGAAEEREKRLEAEARAEEATLKASEATERAEKLEVEIEELKKQLEKLKNQ